MGVDGFSDLDDFVWFFWSEQQECPRCGSTDIEQVDARTWKCQDCGYQWCEL